METKEGLFVSKLSVKGIGCKPGACEADKPALLCRIFGKADGIKTGESQDGRVWSALTGSFAAINLQSGEEYRSGKLFLPSGIHETVENAVRALGENKEGLSITFGLEIRSVTASNPIGYSYQAANLVATTATDELSELRKAIEASHAMPKMVAAPAAPATESKTKASGKGK